ncbi:MAG: hypothetical protein ACRDTD_17915 [Pseudonocardiaceae bacterium]
MSGASTVQFRRFDRAGARERRDIVASIYRDAYAANNASRTAANRSDKPGDGH